MNKHYLNCVLFLTIIGIFGLAITDIFHDFFRFFSSEKNPFLTKEFNFFQKIFSFY